MFVTMVLAALVVDGLFSLAGLVPSTRSSTQDVFGSIELNYEGALNAIGLVIFVVLFAISQRRRPTTPPQAHAGHDLAC